MSDSHAPLKPVWPVTKTRRSRQNDESITSYSNSGRQIAHRRAARLRPNMFRPNDGGRSADGSRAGGRYATHRFILARALRDRRKSSADCKEIAAGRSATLALRPLGNR